MSERDIHWKPALLLRVLYFPLLGIVFYIGCLRAYDALPAEDILVALDWMVLLIPAACIVAEILRKKRWPIRLGVLLSPYIWAAGTGIVWGAAALLG